MLTIRQQLETGHATEAIPIRQVVDKATGHVLYEAYSLPLAQAAQRWLDAHTAPSEPLGKSSEWIAKRRELDHLDRVHRRLLYGPLPPITPSLQETKPRNETMNTTFTERTTGSSPGQRVDREAGIIRGVKILSEISKNRRRYTPEAQRQAVPLYEGVQFYVDHPDRNAPNLERPVRECAGVFQNVHYREGQGVFADLKLRKQAASYAELMEIAEDFSSSFGMSHVATGKSRREGGTEVVYEITDVYSVDLVTNPATTDGLFESATPEDKSHIQELIAAAASLRTRVLAAFNRASSGKPFDDGLVSETQRLFADIANWTQSPNRALLKGQQRVGHLKRIELGLHLLYGTASVDNAGRVAAEAFEALDHLLQSLADEVNGGTAMESYDPTIWDRVRSEARRLRSPSESDHTNDNAEQLDESTARRRVFANNLREVPQRY